MFHNPATRPGLPGQGVAILVRRCIAQHFSLHAFSDPADPVHTIWMLVQGCVFGLAGTVVLGAVYVPPTTGRRSTSQVVQSFHSLQQHLLDVTQLADHFILCGDFNASVAHKTEPHPQNSAVVHRFPHLMLPRHRHPRAACTPAGNCLLETCAAVDGILLTGRGDGDHGQTTCRGATRPDHVIVSPDIYAIPKRCTVDPLLPTVFDHAPISIAITVPDKPLEQHVCGPSCRKRVFKWDPNKAAAYVTSIQNQHQRQQQLLQLLEAYPATTADHIQQLFTTIIQQAAVDAGMCKTAPCRVMAARRLHQHYPVWFDDACKDAKQLLLSATSNQASRHTCTLLRLQLKRLCNVRKRAWMQSTAAAFMDLMATNPSSAVKQLSRQHPHTSSPISTEVWQQHLGTYFESTTPAAPSISDPQATARAMDYVPPTEADFHTWVAKAIHRLSSSSAAGLDGIHAAFIKLAVVMEDDHVTHLLTPVLAKMFYKFFLHSTVPVCWKTARLTPVYKKGDVMQPDNYRLLAVSPVLYRMFASCISQCMTSWCVKHEVIPDTQFGFYPGRNIQQAQFLLRHVVQVAKSSRYKTVWAAYIDFKQAYDRVSRRALWGHLKHIVGLPMGLLNPIQALYQDDSYVLVDGPTITCPVHPKVGVKQGCPLSPLLFSLYISDLPDSLNPIPAEHLGVPIDPHSNTHRLTNIMFADDLTLLDSSQVKLQRLLDHLLAYTRLKGLTVNACKSAVMIFNPGGTTRHDQQPVLYNDAPLPFVDEFKFLGLWINSRFSSHHIMNKLVPSVWAAWRKALLIGKRQALLKVPAACLLLLHTFVMPSALFGCQVWGPDVINLTNHLLSPLQNVLITCYKRVLHLPASVASASLLDEVAVKPLQWYWLKAAIKFWNSAIVSPHVLMCTAVRGNLALLGTTPQCWAARLQRILVSLNQPALHVGGQPVAIQSAVVLNAWRDDWLRSRTRIISNPDDPHNPCRQLSTYVYYFRTKPMTEFTAKPAYLVPKSHIPAVHVYSMVRLRLGCLPIRVVLGARDTPSLPFLSRSCIRCRSPVIDDVCHFLLNCRTTLPVRSLQNFAQLPFHDLRTLMSYHDVKLLASFLHTCCISLSS